MSEKKIIEIKNEADAVSEQARRDFLKNIGVASAAALVAAPAVAEAAASSAAAAAGAGAAAPGVSSADAESTFAEWFQGHFQLMTDEEKKKAIERLEKRYTAKYGKKTVVSNAPPPEGVLFGYALDISKCVGCRRCVHGCVRENNQSRYDTEIHWIQVMKLPKGNFAFSPDRMDKKGFPETSWFGDHGVQIGGNAYTPVGGIGTHGAENYYEADLVPDKDSFYFPVQCHQCEKPPCVKVCPVRATFRDPNGIVLIDYNWCIGCRMCQLACPYGARRFNWGEPNLPAEEMNPKTHYWGNRPRMRGVMEKCTFCLQRTREGRPPACLEACPVGARKFGNLLDPDSEIRKILNTKRVFRFKEEFSTYPKFFYYVG